MEQDEHSQEKVYSKKRKRLQTSKNPSKKRLKKDEEVKIEKKELLPLHQNIPQEPDHCILQSTKRKLNTVLRDNIKQHFQETINPIVVSFSRFAHEVTIFANGFVSWVLDNPQFDVPKIDKKFYEDCIKAVQGRITPSESMNHFTMTEWEGNMDYSSLKGLSVLLQTLRIRLVTNGKNHIWMYFRQRQFQALRIQTENYQALQNALYACKKPSKTTFEPKDQLIYQEHYDILFQVSKPEKVTKKWLLMNSDTVLVYYNYLMTIQTKELKRRNLMQNSLKEEIKSSKLPKIKTFSYLPIQSYQRASIDIQGKDILVLLRRMGYKVPSRYTQDLKYTLWNTVLNFPFQRGSWFFNGTITTDGVQVSLLWWKKDLVEKKDLERDETDLGYNPFKKKGTTTEVEEEDKIDLGTVSKGLFTHQEIHPCKNLKVIGIDPGRNYLLTASNGFSLSKKQYYEECGFKETKTRRDLYLLGVPKKIRDRIHEAANQTFRVPDFKDWKANWEARKPLEDLLFKFYGNKTFRNHKFFMYRRTQKCMDKAFNRLLKGVNLSKTVVAFGDGSFPSSSKGELPGPLSSLVRKLSKRIRVVMIDEYNTSKTCNDCHGRHSDRKMHSFVYKKQTKTFERVWKPSYEILQCKNCLRWHQRDSNASKNIKMLLESILHSKSRPMAFCRGFKAASDPYTVMEGD